MKDRYNALLKKIYVLLKTLGYKKEANNFRLFQDDGLAKIINIQNSRYNTADNIRFTINIGIYFEKSAISNRRFKEYECQIRLRPAGYFPKYGKDTWWNISAQTDMDELYTELSVFLLQNILPFLDIFQSKECVVEMFLSGKAQEYSNQTHFLVRNGQTRKSNTPPQVAGHQK